MRTMSSSIGRKRLFHMRRRKKRIMFSLMERKITGSWAQVKLRKLQKIVVPGCQDMEVDDLFQKTADYILLLKHQENPQEKVSEGDSKKRRS